MSCLGRGLHRLLQTFRSLFSRPLEQPPSPSGSEPVLVLSGNSVSDSEGEFEDIAPQTIPPVFREAPWWIREVAVEPSPAVLLLGSALRAVGAGDSAERISWAYQRGRQAAQIRRGELASYYGPRAALRNRCYVVLAGSSLPEPFFTWDYSTYIGVAKPGGEWDRESISHAFPSEAEATAYCLGAGLPALAALR